VYLKLLKGKEGARMNKTFITIIMVITAFLLLPFNMHAQSDQKSAATPPISQALVPEGEFEVKLADALK
jgi:hypothetical protein